MIISLLFTAQGRKEEIQWETIHGLMEDAIYGGRIDSPFDLRVLRAYLKLFFCDRTVSNEEDVAIIPGTKLSMPRNVTAASFAEVVARLPDSDPPLTFGLPANIDRSLQRTSSAGVIRLLRTLSAAKMASSAKYDREKWREKIGPLLEVWLRLVENAGGASVVMAKKSSAALYSGGGGSSSNDPVDDFLVMESAAAGEVCSAVDGTMTALKRVLFGTGLLTPSVQAAAVSLLAGQIPAEWAVHWDSGPTYNVEKWVAEAVRRRRSLLRMAGSKKMSLGDLFHPTTFINALRQKSARKLDLAIDRVAMVCSWQESPSSQLDHCPAPCSLEGLFLQGAVLQGLSLGDSEPAASELSPAPVVTIGFVPADGVTTSSASTISLPVYSNPTREDYVLSLDVPVDSAKGALKWVLCGCALFLSEE